MQKIFIVTGELSVDKSAAWYLKRLFQFKKDIYCQAVGGDFLQSAGADIYKRFETLNVAGFVEIASKLFFILRFLPPSLQQAHQVADAPLLLSSYGQ